MIFILYFCPTSHALKDYFRYHLQNKLLFMNVKLKIIKTNIDKGRSFFLFLSFLNTALVDTCLRKGEK